MELEFQFGKYPSLANSSSIKMELEFPRLEFHLFLFYLFLYYSTLDDLPRGNQVVKLDFGLKLEFNKLEFQKQSN